MRLLENDIITPLLLRRFRLEGEMENGDGRHYGIIPRDDGSWLVFHPHSPALDPMQMLWAQSLLALINKDIHHDGAWVIVFTHPQPVPLQCVLSVAPHAMYGRYAIIWLDKDADPQFSIEWELGISSDLRDFACVIDQGIHATGQKCEGAWGLWQRSMRAVLDPKQNQLFKRAKGERAPSSTARH